MTSMPPPSYERARRQGTRHFQAESPAPSRLKSFLSESLLRNSLSLILNIGITAVCGFASLGLLTHIYSVQAVGLSAAAVSASSLVVSLTQFGTDFSVPRYLPTSKNRVQLINTLHTGVILSTAVAAAIFLMLPTARSMFALGGAAFAVAFIVISCMQAGFTLLGIVLVADRNSGKLTIANIVPNVLKLAAPSAFSALHNLGAFVARTISTILGYVFLLVVVARGGHRFRPTLRIGAVRELGRFSMGMYVASTIGGLPQMLLPIVALSRLGARESAYWSVSYAIGTLFFQLPSALTQALLPEVSSRPLERKHLLRRASLMITAMVLPVLGLLYLVAPFVLDVFGRQYEAGALPSLRWLIAAGFITMLNYVTGTVLFLAKKSRLITIVNAVDLVIVLGIAYAWASNAQGIAISWFVGDIGNTVLFAFFAYLAIREVGGRYEDLGGRYVASATAPASNSPSSLRQAFDVLSAIAEQQWLAPAVHPNQLQLSQHVDTYPVRPPQRTVGNPPQGPVGNMQVNANTGPPGRYGQARDDPRQRPYDRQGRDGYPGQGPLYNDRGQRQPYDSRDRGAYDNGEHQRRNQSYPQGGYGWDERQHPHNGQDQGWYDDRNQGRNDDK